MRRCGGCSRQHDGPARKRVGVAWCLMTTNLDFTEWGEAFPNKLLGVATLNRLKHGAYRLILDEKSYRKPRPIDSPGQAVTKPNRPFSDGAE